MAKYTNRDIRHYLQFFERHNQLKLDEKLRRRCLIFWDKKQTQAERSGVFSCLFVSALHGRLTLPSSRNTSMDENTVYNKGDCVICICNKRCIRVDQFDLRFSNTTFNNETVCICVMCSVDMTVAHTCSRREYLCGYMETHDLGTKSCSWGMALWEGGWGGHRVSVWHLMPVFRSQFLVHY